MSRSYRKPWVTDGYKGSKRRQFFKNHANRVIRKATDVPNGKAFRKFSDTWNICDYRYLTNEKSDLFLERSWYYNRK